MKLHPWCILFALPAGIFACSVALAAPDRLNDDVPDAIPDQPGAFSFSYGHETINTEGPLVSESTAHDYYKLRYTFNEKVAVSFRLTQHDLVGGLGLISPLFDNQDFADSYSLDLTMNLLNIPRTDADEEAGVPFAAGSSFNAGVSGSQFQLDAASLSRDETMLKAYLTYSTDLTEEMRAHTYFSTGRLSGDLYTGSVNRVGAGLDYELVDGSNQLVLMANGTLDIYNFRQPAFNTSRVSRFDVGLRYRVTNDWYASVGWVTVNDSENEASGSGFFAGLNFLDQPKPAEDCIDCEEEEVPEPAAPPPPPPPPPPEQGDAGSTGIVAEENSSPPLMAVQPAAEGNGQVGSSTSSTDPVQEPSLEPVGVEIPAFPESGPIHTPVGAVMVRAGQPLPPEALPEIEGEGSEEPTEG